MINNSKSIDCDLRLRKIFILHSIIVVSARRSKIFQRQKSLLLLILRKHVRYALTYYWIPYQLLCRTPPSIVLFHLFVVCNSSPPSSSSSCIRFAHSILEISQMYTQNKINRYHFKLIYCSIRIRS